MQQNVCHKRRYLWWDKISYLDGGPIVNSSQDSEARLVNVYLNTKLHPNNERLKKSLLNGRQNENGPKEQVKVLLFYCQIFKEMTDILTTSTTLVPVYILHQFYV